MKITRLDIQGFRSLNNISWQPGDLNVVIGPNASGKSNLLKALELLSSAAKGELTKWIDDFEGGFSRLLWDGTAESISIEISLSPNDGNTLDYPENLYELVLKGFRAFGGHQIVHELFSEVSDSGHLKPILKRDERGQFFSLAEHEGLVAAITNQNPGNETFLSYWKTPETINFKYNLGEWRIILEFLTNRDASIRKPSPTRYSQDFSSLGEQFIQFLHTTYSENREFKKSVNDALRAAFGDDFEELVFSPAYENRVLLGIRWKSLKRHQTSQDLSDGTLRFLFIIAALANPNPPSLIAIDEPETGLHPSMLPIIAEYAEEAALKTQVIFTTHSVEFLDAFQGTPPTVTVAKWADGETKLEIIDGEKLAYWLQDYTLGNLFRTGTLEGMVQ